LRIESYSFGRIVVSGREYSRDLIILPGKVRENWWRKEGHRLCLEDLEDVLKEEVEVLVIGTGYYGMMEVPEDVRKELERRGIEVVIERTRRACDIFNKLSGSKKVAAALHLTC